MSDEAMVMEWKSRPDWSQPMTDHPAGAISLTAPEGPNAQSVTSSVFVICITFGSTC